MKNRWTVLSLVVVVGVIVDQVTKQIADAKLKTAGIVEVIPGFFQLRYARNRGAFFSLGESMSEGVRRTFFIVATFLAIGLITQLFRKATDEQRALRWALMLLLAGAFGNLIDRAMYGEVIDFLHLHIGEIFHWATFNFADIYIAFGFGLLIVDMFSARKPSAKAKEKSAA